MTKKPISLKQWVVLSFLSSLILLIVSISSLQSYKYPKIFLRADLVEITLKGAVKYPGVYKVYPGSKIQDLLKRAKILDVADLTAVDLLNTIVKAEVIIVPSLEKILINVRGAVKEETIELKPGTRICSLKKYLTFYDDADLSVLNSRKKLNHLQKIFIPYIKK